MQYQVQTLPRIPRRWGTVVYGHGSPRKVRADRMYPLHTMEIGDSFDARLSKANNLRNAAWLYRKHRAAWKRFTVRKVSAIRCRCWRIQ